MTISNDIITTYRGDVVENRHGVHAAIVDAHGTLLYAVGNPSRMTLARSAAKPTQALAILETGGVDHFAFDDADLALMCASHNSEERHLLRARAMLDKVDAKEEDLRCGGHAALSDAVNRAWIKADHVPTAIYNNCSGKHIGMLAGAKAMAQNLNPGAELDNKSRYKCQFPDGDAEYHLPNHPVQVRVKRVFEELCAPEHPSTRVCGGYEKAHAEVNANINEDGHTDVNAEVNADGHSNHIKWGLDGCNLPAPACPLYMLGKTYALLAAAADTTDLAAKTNLANKLSSPAPAVRTQYQSRIYHAMAQYPELIAGEGRFCTDLGRAFQGLLVGKLGADGCYGIGVRGCERTRQLILGAGAGAGADAGADVNGVRGSDALGIAVKIEDGNINILYAAVVEILEQLQIGTPEMRRRLVNFHYPRLCNTVGAITGHVSHSFRVRAVNS